VKRTVETRTRVRLRFTKKGAARFLSHHDLMRFFERAIRRAGLPVKMSQGFNPRPRFSIAAALGVGVTAEREILDVEFNEGLDPAVVRKKLSQTLIEGIEVVAAGYAERKSARVTAACYQVRLPRSVAVPQGAIDILMGRDEVVVERKSKKTSKRVNIRPCILEIEESGSNVRLRLKITSNAAARPEEVIAALIGDPKLDRSRLQIVRTDLEVAPQEQV